MQRELPEDSLERVERLMQMEDELIEQIRADKSLPVEHQDRLIRGLQARLDDQFWNPDNGDEDDDALAILVRKLGPGGPLGKFGAAVRPEPDIRDELGGIGIQPKPPHGEENRAGSSTGF